MNKSNGTKITLQHYGEEFFRLRSAATESPEQFLEQGNTLFTDLHSGFSTLQHQTFEGLDKKNYDYWQLLFEVLEFVSAHHNMLGKLTELVEFLNTCFDLAEKSTANREKIDLFKAKILANKAKTIYFFGSYTEALQLLLESQATFEKYNDEDGSVKNLYNLANIHFRLGDLTSALLYTNKSLEYFLPKHNKDELSKSYSMLGMIYFQLGDYALALENYLAALAKDEQEPVNKTGVAIRHFNIASLYGTLNEYDAALSIYAKSLSSTAIPAGLKANINYNVGLIKHILLEFEEAKTNFTDALALFTQMRNKDGMCLCHIKISMLNFASLKNFEKGYFHLEKLHELTKDLENIEVIANYNFLLGYFHAFTKHEKARFEKAEAYYFHALELLEENALGTLKYEIYRDLAGYYQKAGKFKDALEYLQKYTLTKQEHSKEEYQKSLQGAQIAFLEKEKTLLEQKNAEILEQKAIVERQGEEIEHQNTVLQETNETLKTLQSFQKTLIGTIVHDLKNPINVIFHSLRLEDPNRMKSQIEVSSKAMLHLVQNLLDVQKLEEASLQISLNYEPITSLFEMAAADVAPFALEKQLTIHSETDGNIAVLCDKAIVVRVLINFLTNAIKYSRRGGVIYLFCHATEKNDHSLIGVSDEGAGIAPDKIAIIFDKFSRADEGRSLGKSSSTGLGLTFCKMAVEAHSSTISVASEVGTGSTFSFVLPSTHRSSADITELQKNELLTPEKQSLLFTPEEQKAISHIATMINESNIPIYEYSTIMDIVAKFYIDSRGFHEWTAKLEEIVFVGDKELFQSYLNSSLERD